MSRIEFFTGTRADYGLLAPVMRAVQSAGFSVAALASGTHLSPEYGETIREIVADGFRISSRIPIVPDEDSPAATATAIGRGVVALTDALEKTTPDLVFVLGDRHEALAAAIATVATGRALAHIHGGDRSRGGLDESFRHAITKLAHLHFTATEKSRDRVVKLGEPSENVFVVGAPGLDSVHSLERWGRSELSARLGFELPAQFMVLIQHPISTDSDAVVDQLNATLSAVRSTGLLTVVIKPNSDAGGRRAAEIIDRTSTENWLQVFANLEHPIFLNLLSQASVLVGNSSCGIIEAASFGLPVVDVGPRQAGRECADNVIHCDHDASEIESALRRALDDRFRSKARSVVNPYGDGSSSKRIANTIANVTIDSTLLQKQIAY